MDTRPIANLERALPSAFLSADGLHVTQAACDYIRPLIEGEFTQPVRGGLPDYRAFELPRLARLLPAWAG